MAETNTKLPVELPDPAEIVNAIMRIDEAFQKVNRCGLNMDALVTLLHRSSGVSRAQIVDVLHSLARLKTQFLVQPKSATKK